MINTVYVGYDPDQVFGFSSCVRSLKKYVNVVPLIQKDLRNKGIYTRPIDPLSSTEFTFTRFLVPYLSEYKGWSLFCDADFLWLCDPNEVFNLANDDYSVMVVKHDYTPKSYIKMNNKAQYHLPRKNWSSLMLFNNSKCTHLTPDIVNQMPGSYLHRFQWLGDSLVGSLPIEYNWLVGYYKETDTFKPKALHYTDGGPWLPEYRNCEYSDIWYEFNRRI